MPLFNAKQFEEDSIELNTCERLLISSQKGGTPWWTALKVECGSMLSNV